MCGARWQTLCAACWATASLLISLSWRWALTHDFFPASLSGARWSSLKSSAITAVFYLVCQDELFLISEPERATCLQAGLDSLGAVDLRNAVAARWGIAVPATLAFDFPTISALAQFVASKAPAAASQTSQVCITKLPA